MRNTSRGKLRKVPYSTYGVSIKRGSAKAALRQFAYIHGHGHAGPRPLPHCTNVEKFSRAKGMMVAVPGRPRVGANLHFGVLLPITVISIVGPELGSIVGMSRDSGE